MAKLRNNSTPRKLLRILFPAGLLLAVGTRLLLASGVPGPVFQVNTFTEDHQFLPVVGMNPTGASVVVWTSRNQDGNGHGIFAQRFDASGAPQGTEFPVNTTTAGDQVTPAVVMDSDGNFVISWSGKGPGDDDGIFAQRFDSSGAAQGGEFRINTTTSGLQILPVMAISGNGNFLVAWETATPGFCCGILDSGGILAQRFDSSGLPLGGEFQVNTSPSASHFESTEERPLHALAMEPGGNFVVVWEVNPQSGQPRQLDGRLFQADGTPNGSAFPINTTDASHPALAMDASGNFIAAYQTSDYTIRAQRYDASGARLGSEFQVNNVSSFGEQPAVAMNTAGDFVVTGVFNDGDLILIFARCYDANGTPQGDEFQVIEPSFDIPSRTNPALATDAAGNILIVWNGFDASGTGIYARRYTVAPALPFLSISDVRVLEDDSGSNNAVFNVILSRASTDLVTVDFATTDGSAAVDNDYVANSGTLTFAPGETSKPITVLVIGDALPEPDESFFVNLSNPTNASIFRAPGAGTILNDDNTLSINDVAVTRPRTGTTVASFTVTLSGSHDFPVTLDFATGGGTAVVGTDYVFQSGTLTFPPTENTREISVVVNGDALARPDSAFFVALSNSTNAIIGKAQGVGSIHDPDYPPVVPGTQFAFVEFPTGTQFQLPLVSHAMGMNAPGQFVIAFVVPQADGSTAIFAQRFAPDGTRQGDLLRVDDPASVFFPHRAQPAVAVDADGSFVIVWTDGNFNGTLFGNSVIRGQRYNANGTPLGPNFLASGAIDYAVGNQHEETPSVAMTAPGEFVVAWSGLHLGDADGAKIYAQSFDSSDAAGSQFRANTSGSGFAPATTASPYEFLIAWAGVGPGDSAGIFARRFFDNGVPLGDQFGVNTYTDDVQELPAAGMDAAGNFVVAWEGEGPGGDRGVFARCFSNGSFCSGEFPVQASRTHTAHRPAVGVGASGGSVIAWDGFADTALAVSARLYDTGGAAQGTAFQVSAPDGFASFRPEASMDGGGNLVISWLADAPFSAGRVRIFARRFVASPRPPALLPSLNIGNASVTRPLSGIANAVFTVHLSAASLQMVTVDFATASGTATAGADYQAASGTLTFAPGETTRQINVQIFSGTSGSPDKTFLVNLSNPTNVTISRGQGVGVILARRAIDYTISAVPPSLAFTPSTTNASTITLRSQNGVGEAVQLTTAWIGTAPTGVTVQLSPTQVAVSSSGVVSSTLTVTTSASPSTGTFTLRITGQSASGVTESVDLSIFIEANLPTTRCACTDTGPFVDPRVKGLARFSDYATVTFSGDRLTLTRNSDGHIVGGLNGVNNVAEFGFSPNGKFFVLLWYIQSAGDRTNYLTLYSVERSAVVGTDPLVNNPLSWGFSPDDENRFFLVTTSSDPNIHADISIYDTGTARKAMEHSAFFTAGVGKPAGWTDEVTVNDNDSDDDLHNDNDQVGGWGFSPDGSTFVLSYKTGRVLNQDRYLLGLWDLRNTNREVLHGSSRSDVAAFWQFSPCSDLLMLVSQAGGNPANSDLVDFYHTSDGTVYRELNVDISRGDPSANVVTRTDGGRDIELTGMSEQSIPSPQCTLSVTVHSPVNIVLIDEEGRRSGFDPATGGMVSEIPRGSYTGVGSEPQTITVPYSRGPYVMDAYGLASLASPQPYTLTIASTDGSQDIVERHDVPAMASRGSLQRFTFILDDEALLGSIQIFELGDMMPPEAQCAAPDGQWHVNDVSLACTATDPGSGLANPADASFALSTHVAADDETNNAVTDSRRICDVAGNCGVTGPIAGNMVDKKAPSISIAAPGGIYLLGEIVAAAYACGDGGSGVASCQGPVTSGAIIDTATAGRNDFLVNAADRVANHTSRSAQYQVCYGIGVLYDPLIAKKSGSAYPIKVQLRNASGQNVSSPSIIVHAISVTRASNNAPGSLEDTGNANPGFDFRYDSSLGGYIFNLSTKGILTGTYNLNFTAGADLTTHSVAFVVK